jgi:hypothetical protein
MEPHARVGRKSDRGVRMTLYTTSPGDEREAFEAWYVADAIRQGFPTMTVEEVKNLRDDDHYGAHRAMLNGKWEGWQARASSSTVQQVGAEELDFYVVPTGWKLVPVEPTPEMVRAGLDTDEADKDADEGQLLYWSYKAMLATAPSPKSEQGDQQ